MSPITVRAELRPRCERCQHYLTPAVMPAGWKGASTCDKWLNCSVQIGQNDLCSIFAPAEPRCADCAHFVALRVTTLPRAVLPGDGTAFGECRRRSPHTDGTAAARVFPRVLDIHLGCGDFAPRRLGLPSFPGPHTPPPLRTDADGLTQEET